MVCGTSVCLERKMFINGREHSVLVMTSSLHELANSLSLLERKLLPFLTDETTVEELVAQSSLLDVEVKRALMWLGNRNVVTVEQQTKKVVVLGENGKLAATHGLPEIRILQSILAGKKTVDELTSDSLPRGEIMACIGVLKSKQVAMVENTSSGLVLSILPAGKVLAEQSELYQPQAFFTMHTSFPLSYDALSSEDKALVKDLAKRKDFLSIQEQKKSIVRLTPLGRDLLAANIDVSHIQEQLTSEMLKSGSWKDKTFRTYDVASPVPKLTGIGRRHPTTQALNLIRDIYIDMGFTEMAGPWVETAFWCMDSMWIPQDHPARDVQDTFFIGRQGSLPDETIVAKVKEVHETGGDTGSTGYQKPWDVNKAKELLLRTHSTATSFRYLADKGDKDGKYFYIANVFRNEAVDATHLAEFVQAEGFVVGDDLTLSDLMGFIKEFYARLGIHKIRFKPTYNPYTEPSLEAHYYDEQKGKWYALINSGIFRPESLAPYGIKKTVIAWGMGASRVASILNKKNNLRELVGPTVSFDWIANHKTPKPDLEE